MMNREVNRLGVLWERLSRNQRVALFAIAATVLIAVGLLVVSRPPVRYQTAFSGLSGEDAAAIVDQLQSQGISYKLSSDGGTIRVPAGKVPEVRLAAASEGLPKGSGVGFELFDKTSFGITDFQQRINYQRAIEGELERTIDTIDAVASARVHIVVPEESLFTDQQEPTTASVVLQLRPNEELTKSQVRGITHLVSGSVPGLKPENLTVIDSTGNPIWAGTDDSSPTASGDDQLSAQQSYERSLEQQLQTLVNRVVGSGHSAVRVSATLNWDQRTVDSETYSPDGSDGQIRSQQESTTHTTGTSSGAEGVPGVDSNVQSFQEGTPTGSQSETETRDVTTNYELSRRVEHVVEAPGSLERLSVAVVLDGKEVDPAVAQEIQNVVSTAAGIIPQRGDTITVSAVEFSEVPVEAAAPLPGESMLDLVLRIAKVAGLILVPILALLLARRVVMREKELAPLARGRAQMQMASAPSGFGPAPVQQPPSAAELQRQQMLMEAARARAAAYEQVAQAASEDPARVQALIRHWMNEGQ